MQEDKLAISIIYDKVVSQQIDMSGWKDLHSFFQSRFKNNS